MRLIKLRFNGLSFWPLILRIRFGLRFAFLARLIKFVSSLNGITTFSCPDLVNNFEAEFSSCSKGRAYSNSALSRASFPDLKLSVKKGGLDIIKS